jgi:hypothetical protein
MHLLWGDRFDMAGWLCYERRADVCAYAKEAFVSLLLSLHSIWRWVLLAAAIIVVVKSLVGWLGRQSWTTLDDRLGLAYVIAVDVQVLLGLLIWLFGPIGLKTLSQAMGNPGLRFLALEHPILMLISLAFAHIGRSRSKRMDDPVAKHRTAFIFYALSLLFLAAIFLMA